MNERIGYMLSSEEHSAPDRIRNAMRAEEAGFGAALISDHYHPWTDLQGNSPFVWSVIGAISQVTERLRLGTGVTCPTMRIHPAVIAQAAATAATMMPGRFFLGVGAGENLNEHVVGKVWPPPPIRLEMLEEAIEVIRLLWQGGTQSHRGQYFVVDDARIYNLPEELPRIMVSAGGPAATRLAGGIGDGLVATSPDRDQMEIFRANGGPVKSAYGKLTVSWAKSEREARRVAHRHWPNEAMGSYKLDLRLPEDFEAVAAFVSEEDVANEVLCSPDPAQHVAAIQDYYDVGFDVVFVHQVGPDQEGFLRFYERHVLPEFERVGALAAGGAKNAV